MSRQRAYRSRAACCILACLALASGFAPPVLAATSAPLLAWSNADVLTRNGLSSRAVYQVGDVQDFAGHLVLGALGKALGADLASSGAADLVVVFLSEQVDASALRQAAQLPALQPLVSLLGDAQSSLLLPFLQAQGVSLAQGLQDLLLSQGVNIQAVGCAGEAGTSVLDEVKAALAEPGVQVLLVCPGANPMQASTTPLASEVAAVAAIVEAVQAEAASKRVLFAVASNGAGAVPQTRRRLQEPAPPANGTLIGFGPYTECGELCRVQTRWLEGMIALLVMTLALGSGMSCLYLLNTPTRFETQKEGAAN